jgi:hypothetical protein
MQKLTIAVATIAFGAALASAPASAERNWGPIQQNGQCWNTQVNHGGNSQGTWGFWGPCPQKASAPVVVRRIQRHYY